MTTRRAALLGAGLGTLGALTMKGGPAVGSTPNTHLRATVQAPGSAGDPFTATVDGADSTITVNGKPGYAPVAGDRVMVTRLGTQIQMVSLLSGEETITAGVFQTADTLGDGATPGFKLADDVSGSWMQFWSGTPGEAPGVIAYHGSSAPGFAINSGHVPGGGGMGVVSLTPGFATGDPGQFALNGLTSFLVSGTSDFSDAVTVFGALRTQSGFPISSDGNLTAGAGLFTNDVTTSTNAVNAVITSGGRVVPHSSGKANKLKLKRLDQSQAREVLRLEPHTWIDRHEHERDREPDDLHGLNTTWGFVVEQAQKDAPDFVATHGPHDDVDTQAVLAALLRVVQDQEKRIEALEATVAGHKGSW